MSLDRFLQSAGQGWRGPALAALVALIAGLPGVFAAPPLDRDESRFAQATAQMLETGDFVTIRFQEEPRFKKPVGIHWLQAASVAAFSQAEARDIWAYRLPSLLGAMLAAAACAWGARAFFGGVTGLVAGALLGASFLLSTEAFIAKTDAMLAGTTTLALAALGKLYAARHGGEAIGWATKLLFWLGVAGATLIKGPVGPMVVALTALALWAWDRRAPWARDMAWRWGPVLFLAIVGPWALAVTVATDGAFWAVAIGGDLAPKLAGGQESHGAPPGYHTLLGPFLIFPGTVLIPAALIAGWKDRALPGVRFALCWLIPTWLVFEASPTKLVHYTLPAFGALAWLIAHALTQPLGRWARWIGAALSVLAGALFAALAFGLVSQFGDPSDATAAAVAGGLLAVAGLVGAWLVLRDEGRLALATAGVLGVIGHGVLLAGLAPRLEPLWLSRETAELLEENRLLPRQGLARAPVAVAGYAEPSLVFALGTPTDLGGAAEAAQAIADHRPAVVEAKEQPLFEQYLIARDLRVREVGEISGLNYSNGDETRLRVFVNMAPRPPAPPRPVP